MLAADVADVGVLFAWSGSVCLEHTHQHRGVRRGHSSLRGSPVIVLISVVSYAFRVIEECY